MKRFHPAVSFACFLSVLLLTMLLRDPVVMAGSLFGGVLYNCALSDKARVKEDLRFYPVLFLLVTLTNPVFSHNGVTPLFFLNGNAFTLEALVYGAFIASALVAVLLWSRAYSEVVTSEKFLFLFGRALPKTALVLSVCLRYLPLLRRDAKRLKESAKTLGLYTKESFVDRFVSNVQVYYALVGRTLENAVAAAESMRARGFGAGKNVPFAAYRLTLRDAVGGGVLFLLLACVLAPVLAGATGASFYPVFSLPPFSLSSAAFYAAFLLLALFPSLAELEVTVRWRLFQSKL